MTKRHLAAILAFDAAGYTASLAADARATVDALNHIFRVRIRPAIEARNGRVFKLTGDGALAAFPSAAEAILAAYAAFEAMRGETVRLRAGLHVGDVLKEGGDRFGDAVAIATRLQAAAPVGGVYLSRVTSEMAGGGLAVPLRAIGMLRLKGVPRPVETLAIDFEAPDRAARNAQFSNQQEIRFALSRDGVRLAWTAVGEGPLLVKAPNWIQHLELDWETANSGWLSDLAALRRVVRFDSRGNGLSDRDAPEISFERFVDDLAAVFDAADVDRAPVLGISQGCAVAAAFAARRPERVSALVLIGGFAQGLARRDDPGSVELSEALIDLARANWGGEPPSVRDLFAQLLMPDAVDADRRVYAETMREIISAENFARFRRAVGEYDVTAELARVACPTLVLHARGDRLQPIEQGRRLAAGIGGAKFVALNSNNHLMPPDDPAYPAMLREIATFLARIG